MAVASPAPAIPMGCTKACPSGRRRRSRRHPHRAGHPGQRTGGSCPGTTGASRPVSTATACARPIPAGCGRRRASGPVPLFAEVVLPLDDLPRGPGLGMAGLPRHRVVPALRPPPRTDNARGGDDRALDGLGNITADPDATCRDFLLAGAASTRPVSRRSTACSCRSPAPGRASSTSGGRNRRPSTSSARDIGRPTATNHVTTTQGRTARPGGRRGPRRRAPHLRGQPRPDQYWRSNEALVPRPNDRPDVALPPEVRSYLLADHRARFGHGLPRPPPGATAEAATANWMNQVGRTPVLQRPAHRPVALGGRGRGRAGLAGAVGGRRHGDGTARRCSTRWRPRLGERSGVGSPDPKLFVEISGPVSVPTVDGDGNEVPGVPSRRGGDVARRPSGLERAGCRRPAARASSWTCWAGRCPSPRTIRFAAAGDPGRRSRPATAIATATCAPPEPRSTAWWRSASCWSRTGPAP